jgi:hypothetical protein
MYAKLFIITLFIVTLSDIIFYTEFIVPKNISNAKFFIYILSRFRRVNIDGVWIGEWIF